MTQLLTTLCNQLSICKLAFSDDSYKKYGKSSVKRKKFIAENFATRGKLMCFKVPWNLAILNVNCVICLGKEEFEREI